MLFAATARPGGVLAAVAGLACWVVGEDFGQMLTGMATNPNTGPLLILLAAAYWRLRPMASHPGPAPAVICPPPSGPASDCPADRGAGKGSCHQAPASR
jgi:hypothetical protein